MNHTAARLEQKQGHFRKTKGFNLEPPLRVLDAILIDSSLAYKLRSLSSNNFFDPVHRAVFCGMQKLVAADQEISLPNLLDVLDRETLLQFNHAQSELVPRTKPKDIDAYIEKTVRETAIRISLGEINRVYDEACNGGINEEDLIRLGRMGEKLRRTRGLITYDLEDFLAASFPPAESLITVGTDTAIFTTNSINQIFAWRGTGKTMLSLALATAMAQGTELLAWRATRTAKVLYVEGESRNCQLQERLRQVVNANSRERAHFRILTFASQPAGIPPLSSAEGRNAIEVEIGDAEVLFLDSISTLCWFGTNDEENWLDFLRWLNQLRQRGLCVIFLHHAGKSGMSRGHSRSEDLLDVSIKLTREDDADDYLKFKLEYDKFRGDANGVRSLIVDYRNKTWDYKLDDAEKLKRLEEYLEKYPKASSRAIAHDLPDLGSHTTVLNLMRKLKEKSNGSSRGFILEG